MAYVTIAATDYDPDSPITTTLAGAWSNNLTEALTGTGGAPKVQAAALEPASITTTQLDWGITYVRSFTLTTTPVLVPKGLYWYTVPGTFAEELLVDVYDQNAAEWRAGARYYGVLVASDGTNVRIRSAAGSQTASEHRVL